MSHAQLKAFHAVAQFGGFSKAAKHLSLTQPAISDHVRKLEEAHGVQVFLRHARGVELTDLGRKLYSITERLMEVEGQADELLTKAAKLEEGQLSIGADAAVHILPNIKIFMKTYPRVAMRLISGNSEDLITQLLAFSIDFAITAERPPNDGIDAIKIREDQLVVVMPQNSKWARRKTITFSDIVAMPLILRETGSTTRKLLADELQKRGFHANHTLEIEGREAVVETIAQGLGVAVMSSSEVRRDSRLRIVPFADWDVKMEEWLLFLKARSELHLIKSFLKLVSS
jgi:LysR family transcriptional regulator, low CO2-responsive transcriptional regulator